MEITSRQYAIDNQKSRYFTGEVCKRGHISERYTINSGCIECSHPQTNEKPNGNRERDLAIRERAIELREKAIAAKSQREDRITTLHSGRSERREALAEMQPIAIRLHEHNLLKFKWALLELSQTKCPTLSLADVVNNRSPRPGGIYTFRCFPEHADRLRSIQDQFWLETKHDDPLIKPGGIGMNAPYKLGDPVMAVIGEFGRPAWIMSRDEDQFVVLTVAGDIAVVTKLIGHWYIPEPVPEIIATLRSLTR
jgi:hypothetical protein